MRLPPDTRGGSTLRSSGESRRSRQIRDRDRALFAESRCGVLTLDRPRGRREVAARPRDRSSSSTASARVVAGRCLAVRRRDHVLAAGRAGARPRRNRGRRRAIAVRRRRARRARASSLRHRRFRRSSRRATSSSGASGACSRALPGSGRCSSASRTSTGPSPPCSTSLEYLVAFATAPDRRSSATPGPDLLEARPTWARYPLVGARAALRRRDARASRVAGDRRRRARRAIAATRGGQPAVRRAARRDDARVRARATSTLGCRHRSRRCSRRVSTASTRTSAARSSERRSSGRSSGSARSPTSRRRRAAARDAPPDVARRGRASAPVRRGRRDGDTFRFHHALIRDVAYAGIPRPCAPTSTRGSRLAAVAAAAASASTTRSSATTRSRRTATSPSSLRGTSEPSRSLELGARLLGAAGRRALGREDVPAAIVMFEAPSLSCQTTTAVEVRCSTDSAAPRSGPANGSARGRSSTKRSLRRGREAIADRSSARRSSSSGSARTRSRGAAEEDRRIAEALIPEPSRSRIISGSPRRGGF